MIDLTISAWFVLVSAAVSMALGALWYSQALFGHEWMRLVGKSPENLDKKGMGKLYGTMFIAALITSYVLALVLQAFAPQSLFEAVRIALFVWLGLSAATAVGDTLFLHKPLRLFLINNCYNLVSFLLIAALYSFWH